MSPESHWTPKQNQTAEPKAGKCPTSHFPPFNCCLSVVEKGAYAGNSMLCFVVINSVLFNLLYVFESREGYDKIQYAIFRGKPPFQATKQNLNNS